MSEFFFPSRSAFAGVLVAGRHGRPGDAGVTIGERQNLAIAHVAVRPGRRAALQAALSARWDIALPENLRWTASGRRAALWTGPGQWLIVDEATDGYALARGLAEDLADLASVCDQSDMHAVARISGPRARDTLAKGVQIDLHPRVFGPGCTASTIVHHIGVQIWQMDDAPTFDLAVPRSFAGSFWEFLSASAAEFGVEVTG